MYCSNCGKQLKDDDKFCDNCGTPANVGAPESSIQEQEAAAETSADIQEPASEEGIREPEGGSPVAQENEMSVANGEIPEAGAEWFFPGGRQALWRRKSSLWRCEYARRAASLI